MVNWTCSLVLHCLTEPMLELGTEHRNPNSLACVSSQGAMGYVPVLTKQTCILFKTPVTTEQFLKGQRPEGDQHVAFVLLSPLGEFKSYKGTFPPESGLGSNQAWTRHLPMPAMTSSPLRLLSRSLNFIGWNLQNPRQTNVSLILA